MTNTASAVSPRRLGMFTALLLLSTALITGLLPLLAPTPAHAAAPSHKRVFIVGDSLTVGSAPYLKSSLRKKHYSVAVDARVGRATPEGISHLKGSNAKRAGVWVVALGTNDGARPKTTKKYVTQVMKKAGKKRTVIWVNVVRPGGYGKVNTALRQSTHKYKNLVVVDWSKVVKSRKSVLRSDRVHLTVAGYKLRAKVITQSVVKAG